LACGLFVACGTDALNFQSAAGVGGAVGSSSSSVAASTSSSSGSPDAGAPDAQSPGPVIFTKLGLEEGPGLMGLTSFTIITITVTPDGHATWQVPPTSPQCCPNPSGCASLSGTTVLDAALTAMVFHDLALAEPFANRQFDYCPDLGGGTSVTFAGQRIPRVTCGSSTDPLAQAITVDTQALEKAVFTACH
jgi:hypothetical protein